MGAFEITFKMSVDDKWTIQCNIAVRPGQEALQCENCSSWQNRTCNTSYGSTTRATRPSTAQLLLSRKLKPKDGDRRITSTHYCSDESGHLDQKQCIQDSSLERPVHCRYQHWYGGLAQPLQCQHCHPWCHSLLQSDHRSECWSKWLPCWTQACGRAQIAVVPTKENLTCSRESFLSLATVCWSRS